MKRAFFVAVAVGSLACGSSKSGVSKSPVETAVVANGSFESLCTGQAMASMVEDQRWNVGWNVFYGGGACPSGHAIPGWFSDVNGVEVQARTATAADGVQWIELDPFHPSAIWQTVPTESNLLYRLSVAYRARPDNDFDDGAVNVKWNGTVAIAFSSATPGSEAWVRGEAVVLATAATSELRLEDASAANEYGGLLDDVRLTYVGCLVNGAALFDTAACDARR